MKQPLIIMLGGSSQIGKSTLAQQIENKITDAFEGVEVVRYSFADPLRSGIVNLTQAIEAEVRVWEKAGFVDKESLRPLYQKIADEMKLLFGEDIFAKNIQKKIEKKVEELENKPLVVIIDDLRYRVELSTIKRIFIKVHCVEIRWSQKDKDGNHSSETELRGAAVWDQQIRIDKPQNLWQELEERITSQVRLIL